MICTPAALLLHKTMKEFTFFSMVKCNNECLVLINFSDGCDPGDGICENMVRYNNVSDEDRRSYQEQETVGAVMALMNLSLAAVDALEGVVARVQFLRPLQHQHEAECNVVRRVPDHGAQRRVRLGQCSVC